MRSQGSFSSLCPSSLAYTESSSPVIFLVALSPGILKVQSRIGFKWRPLACPLPPAPLHLELLLQEGGLQLGRRMVSFLLPPSRLTVCISLRISGAFAPAGLCSSSDPPTPAWFLLLLRLPCRRTEFRAGLAMEPWDVPMIAHLSLQPRPHPLLQLQTRISQVPPAA